MLKDAQKQFNHFLENVEQKIAYSLHAKKKCIFIKIVVYSYEKG